MNKSSKALLKARRRASQIWPYGTFGILSMIPVETTAVPTMGVDKYWRLYYNPEYLQKLPVDEAAGIILHELSHLIYFHHHRCERLLGFRPSAANLYLWNVGGDLAINSVLGIEGVKLPPNGCSPKGFQFPENRHVEWYYAELCKNRDKYVKEIKIYVPGQGGGQPQPGQGDSDQAEQSQPQDAGQGQEQPQGLPYGSAPQVGGSCADGQQRPWELGEPTDENPGMDLTDQKAVVKEILERVDSNSYGNSPGGFARHAAGVLRPQVSPKSILRRYVSKAVEYVKGVGDYSYRRPSRRSTDEVLLPGNVQPIPRFHVCIDTSGSMTDRDEALGLGFVEKTISEFGLKQGISVSCGDTQTATVGKYFDPKKIKLAGGGGTDMGRMIREAANLKPSPHLIVVITDAETPWCREDEAKGIPVVACVTRNSSSFDRIPKWIRSVKIGVGQ